MRSAFELCVNVVFTFFLFMGRLFVIAQLDIFTPFDDLSTIAHCLVGDILGLITLVFRIAVFPRPPY